jgi:two-component system LytT family response regulator
MDTTIKGMIDAVIIDDEQHGIEAMYELLNIYCPHIKVTGTARHIIEGYEKIVKLKPQVVFLDVEMPGGNGFDLLAKFDPIDFDIIFVTAYHEYAIKALQFSAIDYILKPVRVEDLKMAIERLNHKTILNQQARYEALKENLTHLHAIDRIILPSQDEYNFVKIADIVFCEADNNYTKFHLADGKTKMVSRTLKEYEIMLEGQNFYRIHKSYLANMAHLTRVVKADGMSIFMSNGKELPVSLRRRDEFSEYLKMRK